jgi:hypothetical protein
LGAAPHLYGVLVFDTRLCRQNRPLSSQQPTLQLAVETETLIADVVDTGDKHLIHEYPCEFLKKI